MEEKITTEELHDLLGEFGDIVNDESRDFFEQIIRLLGLPDKDFEILAPGIIESIEQTINNPNNKLALVQSFNVSGIYAEDLLDSYAAIVEEIDSIDLSTPKKDFLKQIMGAFTNAVSDAEGISKRFVEIPIELCHPDAKIPQYAHISDSGMDVYALDDITIKPGETVLVPTGIKVALPPGYELQVRPKSGRALKTKLRVANTPGTIDAGYRDEIKVIIENVDPPIRGINPMNWPTDELNPVIHWSDIDFGQAYTIGKGEKFAQLVLAEVPKASFYRVEKVSEIGEDRGGGFGSTSLK